MQIIKIKNAFQRQDREVTVVDYHQETVEDLLLDHLQDLKETYGLNISLKQAEEVFAVSINGLIVPPEFWDTTRPRDNDQIVFMPIVAKGDSEKQILNIVIMVAAVYFAPGMLGAIQGIGFAGGMAGTLTFAGILGVAAISVGTGMLLNSLTPQPAANKFGSELDDWEASQTYSWNPATVQKQGIVKPIFYGRNRLYGNCLAVHTEVDPADDTQQTLKMLIGLGTGPVEGIVADTIKINDQPAGNFEDVTTEEKRGLLNQTVVSIFGNTKPEFRPNRLVTNSGGAIIYTTPDADYDELEIELLLPRGLYFANNQGGMSSHSVSIKVEISEADAASWSTLVAETITDNVTSPKRKSYLTSETYTGGSPVAITNGTKYDIRVTKVSADQSSARYGDELRLGSIREVLEDGFIYPGTAILGIEALATNQLAGSISVSCVQDGKIVNVYDGVDWNLEFSDNPAWVLYDIFTQPVISGDGESGTPYVIDRYDGKQPSEIDLPKFWELAQFCDVTTNIDDGKGGTEKRITFNGGFDIGTTVWDAALQVCEIARCTPVWDGIKITLAIDKASDPVQMFTVTQIIKDTFKEIFLPQSELISEVEIQYRDKDQDYKRVPFVILDDTITNTTSRATMEFLGVTKQTEAWRLGMFRLAQNRYLKSTLEFDVDIDSLASTIGDVVYVQHDVPEWGEGGRIQSGTTLSIIVDKDMTYTDGDQHQVFVRKADDALNERLTTSKYNSITGVNQGLKQFEIADNFANEYLEDDSIRVADSSGNDKDYTLATGATHDAGTTTLTVNETIPDGTVDGGLFNLRRIVVNSEFVDADDVASAPAKDDVYSFGVQNLHAKEYRITNIRRSSDQQVNLTLMEYNESIYDNDTGDPIITTEQAITTPDTDTMDPVILNPKWVDIERRYPQDVTIGPAVTDVPQVTDVIFSDDVSNLSVSWSSGILSYKGAVYAIAAGSSGTDKYVYWDVNNNPTTLLTSNTQEEGVGEGRFILCINDNGIAFPIQVGLPYWGELTVVETLSALTAQLGDVLAGTIQGTVITGGTMRTAVTGRRVQIDSDGIKLLYGESAGKAGTAANGGDDIVCGASVTASITGITNDVQAVIACNASNFQTGNNVRITGVVGMEQINYDNAGLLEIVDINSALTEITVDFDASASGVGTWSSGGVVEAGSGEVAGTGFLATINSSAAGKEVPFRIESEQTVADFHHFNRNNLPTGPAEAGDICVVQGDHYTCVVDGTPGTWEKTGTQT